jgi:hypothetical protein
MNFLSVKLGVILIGLIIFGYGYPMVIIANAECSECGWMLWKSTTTNVDETTKHWEIVTAASTYEQCLMAKKDLIQKELEVYRKLSKSADVISPDHILAVIREGVIKSLDYYCFPDTIDPSKKGVTK